MSSVAHSYSTKWPISGSAKVGENSCPYAVSRVKNSSPKETITNQCATATTGSRDIRVWPRNSRTSVRVRVAGCPGAGGVGLAEPEDRHEVPDHLGEERDRDRGDGEAQEERNDLQGWHAREFTEQ